MSRLLAILLALFTASPALARPLVVILADARGTETTDLVAPYAVLAESGTVEVKIIAPTLAPVRLMPGKAWVRPQATFAQLTREPDVVVIPFMMPAYDPVRDAWLRERAKRGARIVAICAGAETLARGGLLNGREATTHWFELKRLAKAYPNVRWRRDRRWIVDGPITTTAGVTASIPASLALLRDLAGEEVMRATAARLGVPLPVQAHDGAAFRVGTDAAMTGLSGWANAWRGEKVAVRITDGFDDLAFATALDAWSRTNRSEAFPSQGAVSRHRLAVIAPEKLPRAGRMVEPRNGDPTTALNDIAAAYGKATARYVALTLEHPYWLEVTRAPPRTPPRSWP
ncbi:DJ-1/PfpI family protein [Caulobacter sp. RL271]|uniref:DJ-1/PfpI family protein n=1 Tax=Caulobacter segnis TaxID=88688 RepID=A0ABY4ZSC9_9CAUL|nr:DJ-1/PfpI family protein [Caulobacter segnis]USQ95717.1 DJ-1/PfpI family protein [Caulobacter segnis]